MVFLVYVEGYFYKVVVEILNIFLVMVMSCFVIVCVNLGCKFCDYEGLSNVR